MGKIHTSIPKKLALMLASTFDLRVLVETGTFCNAWTSKWASQHFERVYTVEGFEEFYREAEKRLVSCPNVTQFLGDSREKLPEMLEQVKEPALLWLDAHWLGNVEESRGTAGECPLREELRAVKDSGIEHFILIDDARYFNGVAPQKITPGAWPQVDEIQHILGPGYYVIPDFEDVVIAVPEWARKAVDYYVSAPGLRVVVLTSNDYVRCLPGFAYLFNKFWSHKQPVTVVRYDVRPPKLPANFYCPAIGNQSDYTWSQGLRAFLSNGFFYSGLLVLMLEDYYIDRPVDVERIERLYDYMAGNPEIGKIDLIGERLNEPHSDYIDGLVKSNDDAQFQTSIQAAIWRRDFLLDYLQDNETPWLFEKKGTKRLMAARKSGDERRFVLGTKEPPLHYINAVGGEGSKPGQYDYKKFTPGLLDELRKQKLL